MLTRQVEAILDGLLPFDWYRSFVVDGARMHGLPETYVSKLENVPGRIDPNNLRRRRQYRQPDRYFGKASGYGRRWVAGPKNGWFIDGCYRDRYHDVANHFEL